jgi:monooxygenase
MTRDSVEHVDVLVVGAGISGIAAAHALSREPHRTFVVLDALDGYGGTWRLHRYPGVRSDSDLFTYGFRFKPWGGHPIASGAEILAYLGEAIDEHGLAPHFRYGWRIVSANWESRTSVWRIKGVRGLDDTPFEMTCAFLWMCQGYYRHARGFMPEWPGMSEFQGQIIHPQAWPEGLELAGQRVIVVGSGATAATLVPALAPQCEHVTMLQRSPTYFSLTENRNHLADTLRDLQIDPAIIHEIVRKKVTFDQHAYLRHVAEHPERAREELLRPLQDWLTKADIQTHFAPAYRPWQQRVAVTPGADLFRAFKSGKASIVTDQIERFTRTGVQLKSGQSLEADLVITATGFELTTLGDTEFSVDGCPVEIAKTLTYRGCMFTGLPNLAHSVGYLRLSSWTLRAELIADFVTRLLTHMDELGAASVEVRVPERIPTSARKIGSDLEPFNATYMMRALDRMPRSGPGPDWQTEDYWTEKQTFPAIDLTSETFAYRDAEGVPIGRRAQDLGSRSPTRLHSSGDAS